MKAARHKGDTDEKTSKSKDDDVRVIKKNPKKIPIRQTKQPERVRS